MFMSWTNLYNVMCRQQDVEMSPAVGAGADTGAGAGEDGGEGRPHWMKSKLQGGACHTELLELNGNCTQVEILAMQVVKCSKLLALPVVRVVGFYRTQVIKQKICSRAYRRCWRNISDST